MICPWDGAPTTDIGGGFIEIGEYHQRHDHYCAEIDAPRYQCTVNPAHTFFTAGEPEECSNPEEHEE